jgi:RHS repeat-associated protein
VASFDYAYDAIGNATYRADAGQGVYERFCYDSLNRLTKSALGSTDPGTACAGGAVKTLGYDNLGDITSKSDVGTYAYPAAGTAHPHAVSSIAGTVNGVTNPAYTYDANGSITADAGRTVAWYGFNMVKSITQGAQVTGFVYGPDQERIATAVVGVNQTVYYNDPISGAMAEVFLVIAGGASTWHDYIQADGHIVAERFCTYGTACSTTVTAWRYFVTDHLGSIAVATDATGAVVERDAYDPWGKRRNVNGTDDTTCSLTATTFHGYTGHDHIDANCLINMNARIYDPTIGRFMSADTIVQSPFDSQALNRYAYVENRPLSLTDPTGNDPEPSEVVQVTAQRPTCEGYCGYSEINELFSHLSASAFNLGIPSVGVAPGSNSQPSASGLPHPVDFSRCHPFCRIGFAGNGHRVGTNLLVDDQGNVIDALTGKQIDNPVQLFQAAETGFAAEHAGGDDSNTGGDGANDGLIQIAANGPLNVQRAHQLQQNRCTGLAAEDCAAQGWRSMGFTVTQHVFFRDSATQLGSFVDIVARITLSSRNSPTGKVTVWFFEEVKTGNSSLTENQAAVQRALSIGTAIPGPSAASAGLRPNVPTGEQIGPVQMHSVYYPPWK